jgi:gag-polyprotein putative aspartyl protease
MPKTARRTFRTDRLAVTMDDATHRRSIPCARHKETVMAGPRNQATARFNPREFHQTALFHVICVALLAIGINPAHGQSDDSPPERVLNERGLVRSGAVYIVRAEDSLRDRVAEIDRLAAAWKRSVIGLELEIESLGRLHARYEDVLAKLRAYETRRPEPNGPPPDRFPGDAPPPEFRPPPDSGPPPGSGPPPPDGMAGFDPSAGANFLRMFPQGDNRRASTSLRLERASLEAEIAVKQVHCDDLVASLQAKLTEIGRLQLEVIRLDSDLKPRYAALAGDTHVQQALEALNAGSNAMLMLGPSQDYSKTATATAKALEESQNQLQKRLAAYALNGTNWFTGMITAGETLLQDLAILTGRLQSLEREAASRKNLLAEQAKRQESLGHELNRATDAARKKQIESDLRLLQTRAATLTAERGSLRESIVELTAALGATRADFLQMVRASRQAIDAAEEKRALSSADPRSRAPRKPAPPNEREPSQSVATAPFKLRLRELEKTIRAEKVPLDADKSINWVDVTINSQPARKMVIDPSSDELRLSARFAAEAGIKPAQGDPTVEIMTLDGRTIQARRTAVETIGLGAFSLHDVACVVLPESAGDMPPRLGNSALGGFFTTIDADAASMVLNHVQVKPITHSGKGPTPRLSNLSQGKKPGPSTERPAAGRSSQGSGR